MIITCSRKYYEEEEAAAIAAEEAEATRAVQRSVESVDESGFPSLTVGRGGDEYDAEDALEGGQQLTSASSRRQRWQQGKPARLSVSGRRKVEDVEEGLGGKEDGGRKVKVEKKGEGSRRIENTLSLTAAAAVDLDQEEYYGLDSADLGSGEKETVPGSDGGGLGGRKTTAKSCRSKKAKSKDRIPSIDGVEGPMSLPRQVAAARPPPPPRPPGKSAGRGRESDDELM